MPTGMTGKNYLKLFLVVAVAYTLFFTGVAVWRYQHFVHDGSGDLLLFEQVIHNTAHGRPFYNNFSQQNHFGDHNSPILGLLAPFSLLVPAPYVLFFFTVLSISTSAAGIYLVAEEVIGNSLTALLLSVCYLAVPAFVNLAYQSFHEINLVLPFLTFAFYFFTKERFRPFVVTFVLALLVKEDVAITLFFFAPYALLKKRSRRWVITPAVVAVSWFLLSVQVVIPFFNTRHSYGVGLGYFSNLGGSLSEIAINTVTKPGKTVSILLQANNVIYLMALLLPVGLFLPFLSVESLFAVPSIVFNLLANSGRFKFMTYFIGESTFNIPRHMSLIASVFLFIAAVYSLRKVRLWLDKGSVQPVTVIVVIMSLFVLYNDRFILSKYAYNYYPETLAYPYPTAAIERALPLIPKSATVKSNLAVVTHLYDRKEAYYNLDNPNNADYVLITTGDLGVTDVNALRAGYDVVTSGEHYALFKNKGWKDR